MLIKSRGAREKLKLGNWYIIDLSSGDNDRYAVIRHFIDLEALGREVGCLRSDNAYRPCFEHRDATSGRSIGTANG